MNTTTISTTGTIHNPSREFVAPFAAEGVIPLSLKTLYAIVDLEATHADLDVPIGEEWVDRFGWVETIPVEDAADLCARGIAPAEVAEMLGLI